MVMHYENICFYCYGKKKDCPYCQNKDDDTEVDDDE